MVASVGEILDRKGADVVTIGPDRTLHDALSLLEEHGIGALVVSSDGAAVEGVISERDVVRALARSGAGVLDQTVATVMTSKVETCGRSATADELMARMTNSRFRHMPVVEDGRLTGIVSIGDVVKSRIDELEVRADSLERYVTGSAY